MVKTIVFTASCTKSAVCRQQHEARLAIVTIYCHLCWKKTTLFRQKMRNMILAVRVGTHCWTYFKNPLESAIPVRNSDYLYKPTKDSCTVVEYKQHREHNISSYWCFCRNFKKKKKINKSVRTKDNKTYWLEVVFHILYTYTLSFLFKVCICDYFGSSRLHGMCTPDILEFIIQLAEVCAHMWWSRRPIM